MLFYRTVGYHMKMCMEEFNYYKMTPKGDNRNSGFYTVKPYNKVQLLLNCSRDFDEIMWEGWV